MATAVRRAERALKRAEELINVGEKQAALDSLCDFIASKGNRAWSRAHEKVMLKHVELCVETMRGEDAKDGLIQYRNICQQVNLTSLADVIKHLIQLATKRAEASDLDAEKRPEDLLLSCVSGEKGKDGSGREVVFLWEAYTSVLKALRNNSRLEALYATTAHRAFQYCKQYKRTSEFRRLCKMIRKHFSDLNEFKEKGVAPDLSVPETMQLYLDTRFEQLKVATDLELCQEAFRSVEDVYGLMYMLRKTPKPSLMVVYYSKLAEISRRSSNNVCHGYALLKLFSIQKSFNKNLNHKDLQMIASSAVLAALSALPYDCSHGAPRLELGNENEPNLRLANLIAFDVGSKQERKELSRSLLLVDLVVKGVLNCAIQEVKDLFRILENAHCPLDIALQVHPLLKTISKFGGRLVSVSSLPEVDMSRYVPSLEKVVVLKLLKRVSQVYKAMSIDNLSKMVPFFDFPVVEKIAVDAVNNNFLAMKLDYRKGVVFFGNKILESDGLGGHLSSLTESLNKSMALIRGNKRRKLGETLSALVEEVEREHRRLLARKSIVERRKQEREQYLLEKEQEEEAKRLKLHKMSEEAEQKRLAKEFEQMENQRLQRKIEERELEQAQALLQEARKRSTKKGKKPVVEGGKVTKQALMELAVSELMREKRETENKLKKLGRRIDYLERAKREESAPLIEAAFQKRLEEERVFHELVQQKEVDLSQQCHARDLEDKRRFGRMLASEFQELLLNRRKAKRESVRHERGEAVSKILEKRKVEREAKRKLIYFLRCEEERQTRLREGKEAARRLKDMEKWKEEGEKAGSAAAPKFVPSFRRRFVR